MGLVNPTRGQPGQPRGIEEADEHNALTAVINELNGNLDNANFKASAGITSEKLADADKLGLTAGGTVRRGKVMIAAEEPRTDTSFGLLTTPDRISGVSLPADGLMFVVYRALWKSSVAAAGKAGLFLGATQLVRDDSASASPIANEATTHNSVADRYVALGTGPAAGLVSDDNRAAAITADSSGPQVLGWHQSVAPTSDPRFGGGVLVLFAPAGSYDVSVQYRATSGTVTVKSRKLWVWTAGF